MDITNPEEFINMCGTKLNWKNLSNVIVMDVGCGNVFDCCKAILQQFPDVGHLIALDKMSNIRNVGLFKKYLKALGERFQFYVADVQIKPIVQYYEGMIDKIVSRNAFQEISNKKLAFENVFRMLKPGGETAITFNLNDEISTWLEKMVSIPKWNKYIVENLTPFFPGRLEIGYYKCMMKTIGFRDVQIVRRNIPFTYSTDKKCIALPPLAQFSGPRANYDIYTINLRGKLLSIRHAV
ncbi:uncharacterized protein NPIL_394151 [Nephila pilipes]|uniref:phosphoethanolamine N-methyltransferase n=2 Tax=Nephila pilipes TaxID=299642 RepID=A0A8X6NW82_NEPPI|nr:uncharacterized protein NPIL_394151 [Nephila pilipes]